MIYLECYNDEAVVRGLGVSRRNIEHEPGKTMDAASLQVSRHAQAIGLVDQDPGAPLPPYLREFKVIEEVTKLRLVRYQHSKDEKWLVEIQPDLEPWLYEAARAGGLKPKDYHLPENHRQLHDQPKVYAKRVTEFVVALIKAGSPHLCQLQQWLG
ncbi:MAG: hypothetical protein JWO89_892 [Verrucomicrobiaceae bacterium]|nr:hypothetical protein [Verrucomicrobiaceae bacterium]